MKPPAFQFYASDFLAGTAEMSAREVGAYILLLCAQWDRGGLPDDLPRLYRLARTNNEPDNEAAVRYVVEMKFTLCEDGLLRQHRLERIRAENDEWRKKSAIGGQTSAAKRVGNSNWGKKMVSQRTNNEAPNEPHNEAFNEPTTNTPSPSPSPSPIIQIQNTGDKSPGGSPKKSAAKPGPTIFPLLLDTPAFRAAWSDWLQHRREKKKALTPLSEKSKLIMLESMGEERAIAAIKNSIEQGYTGIFEAGSFNGSAPKAVGYPPDEAALERRKLF